MKELQWMYNDRYEFWALWDNNKCECLCHVDTWSEKQRITMQYENEGYIVKDET